MFLKKWPLEYQIVTKTYLPSNLCDSSDGSDSSNRSDSCDSSDTSDISDSSDSSDQKKICQKKTFFLTKQLYFNNKNILQIFFSSQKKVVHQKTHNSNCDEIRNSNCVETQKLKLWWNSKTQTVMKLKNSNCDET